MGAGDALGQRRLQRFNDTVDDRWKRNAVQSHRRGWLSAQQFAWRKNHFERSESSLVGRLVCRNQILERDSCGGSAAAVEARVDAAAHLWRHLGIIDGHLIAGDYN